MDRLKIIDKALDDKRATDIEKMKEAGYPPLHVEGYRGGSWILLDFDDIIVHVMDRQTRDFYCLEKLWDDAHKIDIEIEE